MTGRQWLKKFIKLVRKIYVSTSLYTHPTPCKCRSYYVIKWDSHPMLPTKATAQERSCICQPSETKITGKRCLKKFLKLVTKIYDSSSLDTHPAAYKCRSHCVMKWDSHTATNKRATARDKNLHLSAFREELESPLKNLTRLSLRQTAGQQLLICKIPVLPVTTVYTCRKHPKFLLGQ